MNQIKSLLTEHPFFQKIPEENLETIARQSLEVEFDPGDVIFQEGDAAYEFYLIREGRVAVESHLAGEKTIPIAEVGPGEVLGWSSFFPPHSLHFHAKVLVPTRAIFLDGARLMAVCENDCALGYVVMKRLAEVVINRLVATQQQLAAQVALAGGKPSRSSLALRKYSWTLAQPTSA